MSISDLSTDLLGEVIKFISLEDLSNIVRTNKRLYYTILLYYPFDNYKLLSELSNSDFDVILKNIKISSEVVFKSIIYSNKHEILKLYLNKIDPSIDNNWGIRWASRQGYYKIVIILLDDLRVDPSANDNEGIYFASKNNHPKVVKLLLSLPKERGVNVNNIINWDIIESSSYINKQLVKLLINDSKIDFNQAIHFAYKNDEPEKIKKLATIVSKSIDPNLKALDVIISKT